MNNSCLGCQAGLICASGAVYLNISVGTIVKVWVRDWRGGFIYVCSTPRGCPEVVRNENGTVKFKRRPMKGSMLAHARLGR